MSESSNSRELCRQLTEHYGAMCVPIVGGKYGINGAPDRIISHPAFRGVAVFVEFKGPKTVIKPLQMAVHRKLQHAGACAVFCRFLHETDWRQGFEVFTETGAAETDVIERVAATDGWRATPGEFCDVLTLASTLFRSRRFPVRG